MTLGMIIGNKGFFPNQLAKEGRVEMVGLLEKAAIRVIAPTEAQSKFGSVETHYDAIRTT